MNFIQKTFYQDGRPTGRQIPVPDDNLIWKDPFDNLYKFSKDRCWYPLCCEEEETQKTIWKNAKHVILKGF